MKTSLRHFALVLLVSGASLGATCNGRQVAKTVLDVAEMSCLLFHDDIEDEKTLAKMCDIAEDLIPEVRKIVFARKSAMVKKAAAKGTASPGASSSSH